MNAQPTFSDLELAASGRTTRRQAFLDRLEGAVPWERWERACERVRPRPGGRGRPAVPTSVLLRMYVLQVAFNLSDVGAEEALLDSRSMAAFVGCGADVPDSTTLCRFRHAVEGAGVGRELFRTLNESLAESGARMSGGTIVDATFVEAPSSTKNASSGRDPEAHQAKKGNNWHFGYKAHIGVDAETGLVHSLETTAANVADVAEAHLLVRPGDETVWADAGYTGVAARDEVAGDPALAGVEWRVAMRRSKVTEEQKPGERALASARAKVEHAFHVLKDQLGHRKTRYRGLAKNDNALAVAFALANALLADRGPRPFGPPAVLAARAA
jgi:IS5 family transposase